MRIYMVNIQSIESEFSLQDYVLSNTSANIVKLNPDVSDFIKKIIYYEDKKQKIDKHNKQSLEYAKILHTNQFKVNNLLGKSEGYFLDKLLESFQGISPIAMLYSKDRGRIFVKHNFFLKYSKAPKGASNNPFKAYFLNFVLINPADFTTKKQARLIGLTDSEKTNQKAILDTIKDAIYKNFNVYFPHISIKNSGINIVADMIYYSYLNKLQRTAIIYKN